MSVGNGTEAGIEREEFEVSMRMRAAGLTSDQDLQEDVYQALLFYFSPWPRLDDARANLHQTGMVGGSYKPLRPLRVMLLVFSDMSYVLFWLILVNHDASFIDDRATLGGVPHGPLFRLTCQALVNIQTNFSNFG